ncbi:hypothetical protein ALC60_14802, partial [Trachymyrmex zeteki]
ILEDFFCTKRFSVLNNLSFFLDIYIVNLFFHNFGAFHLRGRILKCFRLKRLLESQDVIVILPRYVSIDLLRRKILCDYHSRDCLQNLRYLLRFLFDRQRISSNLIWQSTSMISILDLKSETSLCPILALPPALSIADLRPSSDEGPGWDFVISSSSAPTSSKIRATPVALAMICFA